MFKKDTKSSEKFTSGDVVDALGIFGQAFGTVSQDFSNYFKERGEYLWANILARGTN